MCHRLRSETLPVLGEKLAVDGGKAIRFQLASQLDESNFAGVVLSAEHTFQEENASQGDTITTADETVVIPRLDTVSKPRFV